MNLLGRAELIHALADGGPDLLAAAARLSGFEAKPESPAEDKSKTTDFTLPAQFLTPSEAGQEAKEEIILSIPFWRVVKCEYNQPVLTGEAAKEGRISYAGWVNRPEKAPDFIPLTSWARLLPHLRRAAMSQAPGARLNLPKIVDRLSKKEWLEHLPRKTRPTWEPQIHIVLDRSERLTPYWRDQTWFIAQLARLLPAASYRIALYWEGMNEPLFADKRCGDYQIPVTGGLVLVLGDLGYLAADHIARRSWRQFGKRLASADCQAIALFPCGRNTVLHKPESPWKFLAWERQTISQWNTSLAALTRATDEKKTDVAGQALSEPLDAEEQALSELTSEAEGTKKSFNLIESPITNHLLTLLSPAIRIEPGLLRSIRRWQNLDAAVESLFWQHPDLSGTSSEGAMIEPEPAKAYREKFKHLPEQDRLEVLKRIRECRSHVPDEVWFEECALNPDIYRFLTAELPQNDPRKEVQTLRQDIQDAERFFQYHGQNATSFSPSARYWYRRLEKRIPDPEAHTEKLRPALNRLWHAVHHGEPDAKHPAGYNPADIPSQAPLRTWQVFHQDERLLLLEAPHPAAATTEHGASWLGQLQTRNGQISLDDEPLFWQGEAPPWASDWGKDEYGLWVEFTLENVTQRLRWISAGSFLMGSPESEAGRYDDEGPQHEVTLSEGFWLFDTPVTQALWQTVMGDNPSEFKSPQRPVENVSWDDAQEFINKLNDALPGLELCLPSEAQWEYACRAGIQTATYAGDLEILGERNAPLLDDIAWYGGNSGQDFELENGYDVSDWQEKQYENKWAGTHPVGQKQSNPWGLYDMLGNVLEWCQDYWSDNYPAEPQTDPTGPAGGSSRVVRGGSWSLSARDVRAASRILFAPGSRNALQGFRCARVQSGACPAQAEPVPSAEAAPEREPQRTEQGGAGAWVQTGEAPSYTLPWPNTESFILRTDAGALHVSSAPKPAWAKNAGRDRYGLWAEFVLDSPPLQKGGAGGLRQRLRWIPPGRFLMGSPESEAERDDDEGPRHEVTLTQGFWLFDTAVTQALWEAVMGENPSRFQGPAKPVEKVSWNDAQGFLRKLNDALPGLELTLPTEAQWEYACRAGTQTPFYFGDNITPEQVNYNGTVPYNNAPKGLYRKETVDVKSLPPNAWGLYEMHGNVWEWCLDGFRTYTDDAQADPFGPMADGSSRVVRGGSWPFDARRVRAAYRYHRAPDSRSRSIGFRCARVQA